MHTLECSTGDLTELKHVPLLVIVQVEGTLNYTQYFRWNKWDFVNGHLDQGMLWYLFFLRNPVGTWSHYVGSMRDKVSAQLDRAPARASSCTVAVIVRHPLVQWTVDHFWGGPKPWLGFSSHTSRNYWLRLDADYAPAPSRGGREGTQPEQRCARRKNLKREGGERGSGWKSLVGPLPHPRRISHFGSRGHAEVRLPTD